MNNTNRALAKVIANVPPERVLTYKRNGRPPQIGELGEFDHGFTSDSGVPMLTVCMLDSAGQELWAADMLESEVVAVPRDDAKTL